MILANRIGHVQRHNCPMPSRIRELCRQYTAEAVTRDPDGRTTYVRPFPHLRLLANGIVWHQTDFEEILQAGAGLTDTFLSSHNVEDDQQSFIAYCAEVLIGPNPLPPNTLLNLNLSRLLKMCMTASPGVLDTREYLVFPLLEGVTRAACPADVDMDGRVVREIQVPSHGGSKPVKYGRGARINNVHHLLWHLHDRVASNSLKEPMLDIDQLIHQALGTTDDHNGFETIYRLRNSTLHGEDSAWLIYPVINLALLIAIGTLGPDLYEERREEIESTLDWRRTESMWSFYPSSHRTSSYLY